MTYYPDLKPCNYFGTESEKIVAVGWLNPNEVYAAGKISIKNFQALMDIFSVAWQPPYVFAGVHRCEFCYLTGGPSSISHNNQTVLIGSLNLFLPFEDKLIIAPSTILHYIDSHHYLPPNQLFEAIENCPRMRSPEYIKKIKSFGIKVKLIIFS